jgi:hypothetical protein
MSQVYEDLNLSYQREKRSRESAEDELKKTQILFKQSEDAKALILSSQETMKKEIQHLQENNRMNEVSYFLSEFSPHR